MANIIYENKTVTENAKRVRLFLCFAGIIIPVFFIIAVLNKKSGGNGFGVIDFLTNNTFDTETVRNILVSSSLVLIFFIFELITLFFFGYIDAVEITVDTLVVKYSGVSGYKKVFMLESIKNAVVSQDRKAIINNKNLTLKIVYKGRMKKILTDKAAIVENLCININKTLKIKTVDNR